MNGTENEIARLAARIQILEDEAAIHKLLVRYGFAVDTEDVDALLSMYTENSTIEMDGNWLMHGHDEVRLVIEGQPHQSYVPFCAHQLDPFAVEVDGDRAVATGYSRVYLRDGDTFRVERVSFNHYELVRTPDGWKVSYRRTALLGTGQVAHDLLRRGLPSHGIA